MEKWPSWNIRGYFESFKRWHLLPIFPSCSIPISLWFALAWMIGKSKFKNFSHQVNPKLSFAPSVGLRMWICRQSTLRQVFRRSSKPLTKRWRKWKRRRRLWLQASTMKWKEFFEHWSNNTRTSYNSCRRTTSEKKATWHSFINFRYASKFLTVLLSFFFQPLSCFFMHFIASLCKYIHTLSVM